MGLDINEHLPLGAGGPLLVVLMAWSVPGLTVIDLLPLPGGALDGGSQNGAGLF